MSSFIDPSILLSSRPAQIEGALDAQQQAQSLANMGIANQLQQTQLKTAQIQNQQQQQELNDQQAIRKAWTDAGGDLGKTSTLAAQYGASPKALMALNAAVTDHKTKLAALDKDELANHQTRNDQLGGYLAPVLAETDPAKQESVYNTQMQAAVSDGLLSKQEAALHPYAGPDSVNLYASQLKTNDQLVKQATAHAEQTRADAAASQANTAAGKFAAELPSMQADADTKQRQSFATSLHAAATDPASYAAALGEIPQKYAKLFPQKFDPKTTPAAILSVGMTPDQIVSTAQTAANAAETARHNRVDEVNSNQRLQLEAARYSQQYGDPTANASTGELQNAAAIARGDIPMPNARAKGYDRTMALVFALDPTFKESRYLGIKSFRTGTDANSITSITTALAHLDRAQSNSASLGFSPTEGLNITPSQRTYHEDADFLQAEVGKLIKNGVVTEGEANRVIGNLTSPLQRNRDSALSELKELMGGKFQGIRQKYVNATGQELPMGMFNADTQQRLVKQGLVSASAIPAASTPPPAATASPAPASGSNRPGLTPAPAARPIAAPTPKIAGFQQTAVGPGGQRIGSNDGNTWFDLRTGKRVQ